MTLEDYLTLVATNFLRASPILLIGCMGLWRALAMRQRLRRAAIWGSLAFGFLILHAFGSVARDVASVHIRLNEGLDPTEVGVTLTVWALIAYVPLLLALAMLARAFFLDRDDMPAPSRSSLSGVPVA